MANVRRFWIVGLLVAAAVVSVAVWVGVGRDGSSASSNAAMAARAQGVMPFDLQQTRHTFTKTADGGVQRIVTKAAGDTRNQGLIRSHLQVEAQNFRKGDYSDPAKIHGMHMAGTDLLAQGASRVHVAYAEVAGGAQIRYATNDRALVGALHDWFDRQTMDHGQPDMGG